MPVIQKTRIGGLDSELVGRVKELAGHRGVDERELINAAIRRLLEDPEVTGVAIVHCETHSSPRVARPSLRETYEATREAGFSAEVKRRILLGTFVLRKDSYALYYGQAQKVRRLIADDYARAFERCDLVACPTSPVPGFRAGEKLEDPLAMYLADVFTIGANLAGLAAISLPAGLSTATAERPALPIGVQLLAPPLHEPTLTLRFTNGGHNFPVLLRAGGARTLLEKGGLVVGMLEGMPYEEETLVLAEGDRLVIYTDGVTEEIGRAHV